MATQIKCGYCDPPGSGRCRDCQATGKSGRVGCSACQGSGYCGRCYGIGLEPSPSERVRGRLLGIFWVSWIGILGAFLCVGVWQLRISSSLGRGIPQFSLVVLTVTIVSWVLFFAIEERVLGRANRDHNWQALVLLSTLAGTILAVFTLVGTFFFIFIAPRVQ
jgi:hypothetical protein